MTLNGIIELSAWVLFHIINVNLTSKHLFVNPTNQKLNRVLYFTSYGIKKRVSKGSVRFFVKPVQLHWSYLGGIDVVCLNLVKSFVTHETI